MPAITIESRREGPEVMRASSPQCTVCGQRATRPDPFFYQWRGHHFVVYRCSACTHQFVHPQVTPEEQALIYDDRYFAKEGDWVCGRFSAGYVDAEAALRREAQEVLTMLPPPPGRLLDIGCAGGTFLDEARTVGFDVAGIEMNPTMAQYARVTYQLEVLNKRIEDVPEDNWAGAFDVVTLLDCLEHVPQPLATMKKVAYWLRPGGSVFIRGPLSNNPLARLKEGIRRTVGLTKQLPGYPLDANMFNKRSLSALLMTSGFDAPAWIGETPSFSNLLARRHLRDAALT